MHITGVKTHRHDRLVFNCARYNRLVFVLLWQISTNATTIRAPTTGPVRMVLTHTRAVVNRGTAGQTVKKVSHYSNSIRYIITPAARPIPRFYCLPSMHCNGSKTQ